MLQRPPRVAAIHDLSGFGRCSLTVILPVLSVMKVQVCPVTTAVLSTHTGGAWGGCCQGPDRHAGAGARPLQTTGHRV